jgi:PAS domain S-box-containing protein
MGRMIDYDPTDLIGRTIESITHPRDVQRYAMSLENAQQLPDGAQRVIEKRYLTPGGRIVWARVTITAVTDDGGQPDFVVGIVEDITREHERSRSLRNAPGPDIVAPRTPASPTGQLARDFEAMLARIAGAAGDLLREAPGQGRVHDRLTEIIRAAADGAALVQRLLAAPAGDTPPVGPMDLRDICERLVAGLAGELPTGIHLELRLDAETGSCRGDAEMVAQALRNLVTNAVDAMPDGGTVTLSLDKVSPGPAFYASHPKLALGKYFRLRVADTGRGIPATALARVFDPFFTSHRRQDRLGLGLAMVRSAVKRHAGAVTAESIEGQGTTVSLFLPAMADGTWSDAVWGHGALPMPPAGQAVLLVAEDAGLRERVRADLTPQGVPLLAAGNDADAVLDLLGAGHSVALVLMHDAMRGIDQGAVYAQIKRSAPGLPVLFIADGDEATVVVSHVADPGAPRETLAGAVRRLLGR